MKQKPDDDQRKFPTGTLILFSLAHLFVGLILQFIPFRKFPWAIEFFIPIDAAFPAFGTMFLIAKDPLGCKVMLLLWWLVFVPWGVILARRFVMTLVGGVRGKGPSFESKPRLSIWFGILGVLIVYSVVYKNGFEDYSYLLNPNRSASALAFDLSLGPIGVSWHLVIGSIAILAGSFLVFLWVQLHFLSRLKMKNSS